MRLPLPQLTEENANIWHDPATVEAYAYRPPYPHNAVEILARLAGGQTASVLELGCGPGQLACALSERVARVDAVEPSTAMLAVAQARACSHPERIRWVHSTAEEFTFGSEYDAVIAADAIHWMDCDIVMPSIAKALTEAGRLIIATRRVGGPWSKELQAAIPRYSSIRHFIPAETVSELERLGYFAVEDRMTTPAVKAQQSVAGYIEFLHSMSGFARFRMAPGQAAAFDAGARRILAPYVADDLLSIEVSIDLAWGRPATPGR